MNNLTQKPASVFPDDDGTVYTAWLGKTKPQKAFRLTQNAFKKLPWKIIQWNFLLTGWLNDAFRLA